ncbi:unnamed protein product [Cercopithifilaria johnstoni]|uniref:NADH dehydrogenase [ubiquinone] 1 beta subcomplex subunit 11, mitochondrial n=1 Tax=Cercopithifilaria johnstoni TaxID=2874296 RepID=A0A8J2PZA1_9BILA|nr:unnamed protein product [Cercopithifilaria johnstoni]
MLLYLPLRRRTIFLIFRRLSSTVSDRAHGEENIERKPTDYRKRVVNRNTSHKTERNRNIQLIVEYCGRKILVKMKLQSLVCQKDKIQSSEGSCFLHFFNILYFMPGSDSYAYENPWPKLNRGRLDWLFGDGWRRPLAKDQGGQIRRNWIWFGLSPYDEHADWLKFHQYMFVLLTIMVTWVTLYLLYAAPDWPQARDWAYREAHLEMARREKAGLPYISKDLVRPDKIVLPSDEELQNFEIII